MATLPLSASRGETLVADLSAASRAPSRLPVRYRILVLLSAISFANYFLRNNISVSMSSIGDMFSFSHTEIGWIFGSFNVAYALFQIPGGVFGDVLGSRRALTIIAVSWTVLTLLTGFVPHLMVASTGGALIGYIVIRFLMGIANAPTFPLVSATIGNWFPPGHWGVPNAVTQAALAVAQAATGPLITMLIIRVGVHGSFYVLAPVGALVGLWWWWYGRDRPAQHKTISSEEVALIAAGRTEQRGTADNSGGWKKVIVQRDVLLLAASYFSLNYVVFIFAQWLFQYLVEERGFTLLESGLLYALPFATGAVLTLAGGVICDVLCRRFGSVWGCRLPAIVGLVLVAFLLMAGAYAPNPYVAVTLLALCFGFAQFTEPQFWTAATYVGGEHAPAAMGVMNTGGNLAGFLAPAVGLLLDTVGWVPTLATGSVFAILSAVLWLFVRAQSTTYAAGGELRGSLTGAQEHS
jgi:MFS transporter, ACS family, glucarate transporter